MPSIIKFVIKKNIYICIYFRPTDPNFFQHVTVNTLIIFFGLTFSVHTNYQKQYNKFQKHVYWFKQTIESDHVQLILIAAVVQGWNDNDKTNMFGFKGCLIEPIITCKQVYKQTIILEQMKHFVEFLK